MPAQKKTSAKTATRTRILDGALKVLRTKGYAATTVDDLCAEAKITKGAFFHYFDSKEDLAVSAANYWAENTDALFAGADYRKLADPRDRVLGYVAFRRELIAGEIPEFTCLVGTLVQEAYASHPAIRDACRASIFGHAGELAKDVAEAKRLYAPRAAWKPESVALHTQAVLQGAFILAKAGDDDAVAIDSVDHLRRYLEFLLPEAARQRSA